MTWAAQPLLPCNSLFLDSVGKHHTQTMFAQRKVMGIRFSTVSNDGRGVPMMFCNRPIVQAVGQEEGYTKVWAKSYRHATEECRTQGKRMSHPTAVYIDGQAHKNSSRTHSAQAYTVLFIHCVQCKQVMNLRRCSALPTTFRCLWENRVQRRAVEVVKLIQDVQHGTARLAQRRMVFGRR
jgi:hypothetical protein